MDSVRKEYSNGDVTIVWQNALCIHSGRCARGLPTVFDPKARPWITPEGASSDDIIRQVERCPSGALSWYQNADQPAPVGPPAE